jgi:hypothetical protein
MSLDVLRIDGLERAIRATEPDRWWAAIERNAPRAAAPILRALQAAAPKGRTGKLSRGFDARTKRIQQGFVQGVQLDIGSRVPYGHLVERGHKIIPRGPTRFRRGIGNVSAMSGAQLLELLNRVGVAEFQRRGALQKKSSARADLLRRRAGGPQGFVPGQFFAQRTFEAGRDQMVSLLERLLEQELGH